MSISVGEMTKEDLEQMVAEHKALNPDRPVRPDIIAALVKYVEVGMQPGHFLTAVLENNLMEAMARADSYNRASLFQIVSYIYNELPSTSWGSPEKVKLWRAGFKQSNKSNGIFCDD